jgi:hypothetical protein
MSHHFDEQAEQQDPISVVEDLDPEPPGKHKLAYAREFALGIVLLVAVLGFACWQWWQQEYRTSSYRHAQEAEAVHDLDRALSLYSAASDYRDANAQTTAIATLIAQRNEHYRTANEHAVKGEWPAALEALQKVEPIQPDYKNVEDLQVQAKEHIYRDALLGTVAMRPGAEPPGLYYRTQDGWLWLQDSDKDSAVQSWGSGSVVVYDVPGEDWVAPSPGATPTPSLNRPGTILGLDQPSLKGRRLMIALRGPEGLDGKQPSFKPLALDPSQYTSLQGGRHGALAIVVQFDPNSSDPGSEVVARSGFNVGMSYQEYGSSITNSITLPGNNWAFLDTLYSDGRHLLVADWDSDLETLLQSNAPVGSRYRTPVPAQSSATQAPSVRLWIIDSDGTNRRLLYTHAGGGIQTAKLSPDGRYVVLTIFTPMGKGATDEIEKHSVLLLDIAEDNPRPPRILAEKIVSTYEASQFRSSLKSTILFEGAFSGMLLIADCYTDSAKLMLVPVEPDGKTVHVAIEYPLSDSGWLTMQKESQVLFMGLEKVGQSVPKDRFPVLRLSPDGTHTVLYLYNRPTEEHFQDYSAIVGPWIKGDHLVYGNELRSWDSNNGTMYTLNIRTSPLAAVGSAIVESPTATTLYNATVKIDGSLNSQATKRIFGPALFSYIEDDELHAMTYDGKTDVVVEHGVSMLYDLSFRTGRHWLR